jgi:hypothetical protein
MADLWLKIKAWFKGLLFLAILGYAGTFIYRNNQEQVKFWWWFHQPEETSVFLLATGAFFTGMVFTVVLKTTWTTWRQISQLHGRSRTGKLEREMADMKAKAGMLQTRPVTGDGVTVQVDKLGGARSEVNDR